MTDKISIRKKGGSQLQHGGGEDSQTLQNTWALSLTLKPDEQVRRAPGEAGEQEERRWNSLVIQGTSLALRLLLSQLFPSSDRATRRSPRNKQARHRHPWALVHTVPSTSWALCPSPISVQILPVRPGRSLWQPMAASICVSTGIRFPTHCADH